MRRLLILLLPAVALVMVVSAPAVSADTLPPDREVVATEAQLPEDFPGTQPGSADASENAFAPPDYEPNFLWGAAVGLSVLAVVGVGMVALLYWALVVRPRKQQEQRQQQPAA